MTPTIWDSERASCPKQWLAVVLHIEFVPASKDWMACHKRHAVGEAYTLCPNYDSKYKCWQMFKAQLLQYTVKGELLEKLDAIEKVLKNEGAITKDQYMDLMVCLRSMDAKLKAIEIILEDIDKSDQIQTMYV